jgi:hypothetical protein
MVSRRLVMPNWCWNRLIVDGPLEDRQRVFQEVWTGGKIFNKILPEPDKYTDDIIDDLLRSETGLQAMLIEASVDDGESTEDHIRGTRARLAEKAWYYWRIEHWGTKWDLEDGDYDFSDDGTTICFDTAWAPPVPVIRAMSRRYPTLNIRLKYFEPSMCFAGEATFISGEGPDNYYQAGENDEEYWRLAAEFGFEWDEEEEEDIPAATVDWQTEGF